jgi:hypothetical protein
VLLFLRKESIQTVETRMIMKGMRTNRMDVTLSRIIHKFFLEDPLQVDVHLKNIATSQEYNTLFIKTESTLGDNLILPKYYNVLNPPSPLQ